MPPIFVSHASKDDEIVTRLHNELEAATGLNLWVDHKDIPPGANWQITIDQTLRETDAMLLVISRNSANREEVMAEWRDALLRNHTLLIAIIDDIPIDEIPSRLRIIQMVNLHADWNAGIRALTAAIKGEALPVDAPLTPVRPIIGHIDRRLTTIPMTGRDDDLKEILRLLKLAPAAILGMGGLGKSRLAAELALTSPDVDGAVWHTASDISRPDEVIELLRDHFNLEVTADRPAVLKKLRSSKRLIILDNAESVPTDDPRRAAYVKLVDDLADAGGQVLLTSRVEWPDLHRCGLHTPRTLAPDSAAKVVLDMGEVLSVKADLNPHAASIAGAARFHPRLIEWAVGLMRKFPVQKVLADLTDLKSKGAQDALDEMILKTLRQMTEAHGDQPAAILKRLNVCRGGFTYEAAEALTALPENPADSVGTQHVASESSLAPSTSDFALDDALSTLQTYRFVTFDGTRYTIDPLVITAVGEDPSAHRPHYDYYLVLADHHHKKQDYLGLDPESANLEAAFEWALATGDGEDALWLANACGHFLSNRGRFDLRLNWFERVSATLQNHPDKALRANGQNSLGVIYMQHPIGSRRENLHRAIDAYQTALEYYTPTAAPQDYAMTQNNLGTAYGNLAEIEDRAENLQRAIECFQAALKYYTPSTAPLDYAMTQNNLGNAYRNLAAVEDRVNNLGRAIESYQAALQYWTAETAPLYYAATQNNLGIAYQMLAAVEDRADNLRRAIETYQAALEYRTPTAAPLHYAQTQNNLGAAYSDLAEIEDRADNLRRAIETYQAALEYRTPTAAPLGYAMTQNNLGAAYWELSKTENKESNLRQALKYAEACLEYWTPETAPLEYATLQQGRGLAYEDLDDLAAAIACWREAAIYYRQMEAIDKADEMLRWIADAEAKLKG
ncbi:MAG: TIR domain-containing protein [Anaerolineae bacterium]|nr:TIR domain-containing protein [Anaerolineae bacterium]